MLLEKMLPVDMLDTGLPQTFNLQTNKQKKPQKTSISVKHNKAKYNKTRCSDKGKLE